MFQKYLCFKNLTKILLVTFVLVTLANTQAQINPYKILGLAKNADEKQIRNAYRKLAKGIFEKKIQFKYCLIIILNYKIRLASR